MTGEAMVFHNASGQHLRAARSLNKLLVNDSVYWFVCSEQEAGYLTALLNASALAKTFRATRQSDRDFHTHPWKKVPIPRYDHTNQHHRKLASLSRKAEEVARNTLPIVDVAKQDDASNQIREAITETGIEANITLAIKHVIPSEHLL